MTQGFPPTDSSTSLPIVTHQTTTSNNARRLSAGTNILLDTSVPGLLTINSGVGIADDWQVCRRFVFQVPDREGGADVSSGVITTANSIAGAANVAMARSIGGKSLVRPFATGAISGNSITISWSQFFCRPSMRPHYTCYFGVDRITNIRMWTGWTTADPSATDTPNGDLAMFWFSTSAGHTKIQCVTHNSSDATGSTRTITDSGVTLAANTVYKGDIWSDDGGNTWKFAIDGTLVATHTTNTPADNQILGAAWLTTLTGSAATFYRGRLTCTAE